MRFLVDQAGCWASRTGDKTQSELYQHKHLSFLIIFQTWPVQMVKFSNSTFVPVQQQTREKHGGYEEAQEK